MTQGCLHPFFILFLVTETIQNIKQQKDEVISAGCNLDITLASQCFESCVAVVRLWQRQNNFSPKLSACPPETCCKKIHQRCSFLLTSTCCRASSSSWLLITAAPSPRQQQHPHKHGVSIVLRRHRGVWQFYSSSWRHWTRTERHYITDRWPQHMHGGQRSGWSWTQIRSSVLPDSCNESRWRISI